MLYLVFSAGDQGITVIVDEPRSQDVREGDTVTFRCRGISQVRQPQVCIMFLLQVLLLASASASIHCASISLGPCVHMIKCGFLNTWWCCPLDFKLFTDSGELYRC